MTQPESSDRVVNLVVAEFNALNAEMTSTTSSQQTLISLNVTAAAAVAGLVVANRADPKLLLVSAVLSSALGLVYIANAVHIANISSYITEVLRPLAAEHTGEARLLGWIQRYRVHHRVTRLVYRGLMFGLMFAGFPSIALIWSAPYVDSFRSWLGWGFTLLLLVVQIGAWGWSGQVMLRRRNRVPTESSTGEPG
jgi:hypothetical protein